MSFYLDSSVTVSAISAEAATAVVLDWIGQVQDGLVISDWVTTETAAAMSQKLRMKLISPEDYSRALAAFEQQFLDALLMLQVTRAHFRRAAGMAANVEAALRAGDALHLAVAEDAAATLVTLDKQQAHAAAFLNLKVLLLA